MNYIVAPPIQPVISAPHGIAQQSQAFAQLCINKPKGGKGNLGFLAPQGSIYTASPQKSIGNQQALHGNNGDYFNYNPVQSGITQVRSDPLPLYENIGQTARSCGNRNAARNPNLSSQPMLHPTDQALLGIVGNNPTFVPFAMA
tara:strand:+ start:2963 stop:3394 length:432 start_codon:yes stop_codon:yes gene_type:complete